MRALSIEVAFLFFLFLTASVHAAERPLRFSVSDSSTMPMIHLENSQPVDGILHDLHRRIAAKLGRQAEQRVMSRARIQPLLDEDTVDVSCYMNPAWLAVSQTSYRWSVPFMNQHSILVARPETPPTRLSGLRNQRIGTVLGFYYPEADAFFRDGKLIRDDARTEHQVLEKLAAGRGRYAISTQVALDWFNLQKPAERRLKAIDQLSESSIHCIVRDEPGVPAREILDAMRQMQRDGEFDTILAKYR